MKGHASAAERNAEPIRGVLARVLPPRGRVLEIASGTGYHAAYMAKAFPALTWQPSDRDPDALLSIEDWRAAKQLANLCAPVELDVTWEEWPVESADAVVCVNMLHIAPWPAAEALFRGAARVLAAGAVLYTYGPYRFAGAFTAPSNAEFDASLRARNPVWGVRDVDDLTRVAAEAGFSLVETVAMPANNHSLVFHRAA